MNNTTSRLSLILTKDEMNRLNIKEEKGETKIIADVHGMSVNKAKKFINNIINVVRTKLELIVVHGYNHGTAIKDMLANVYTNSHITDKYQDEYNKGVTHILAA